MFNDKSILITGGTGSFGKAFIATILARYKPRRVIVFSRDELKQFEMRQEMDSPVMRYFIGDVRDSQRLEQAMRGVDFVVHAASLKQLSSSEYNPMECIKTNIQGAENVINAALENGVEKVIALSTDKAAIPVDLYGATKLVSDKLFVAANNIAGGHNSRFSVVRYGNVSEARESAIPMFFELIARGGREPPITDLRMTRFWITSQQGVEFVIKSFSRMYGGEIFVPKTPSVRIADLAAVVAPDLPKRFNGIPSGERLHETMCPADNAHLTLEFADHFVIRPAISFVFEVDYRTNALGEKGTLVSEDFEYNSNTNSHFLGVGDLQKFVRQSEV